MSEPSERSMKRALSAVEMTPGSDEWRIDVFNAACREVAAAIDEAREEERERADEAERLSIAIQLCIAAIQQCEADECAALCDARGWKGAAAAIRARSNPSEPAEGGS